MKTGFYSVLARIDIVTWALIAALFVLGGYLLIEQSEALFEKLIMIAPWLLIAACPLIHIVMHGNHGGHGRKDDEDHDNRDQAA